MPWLALTLEVDADAADALSDALLEEVRAPVWQESTEKPKLPACPAARHPGGARPTSFRGRRARARKKSAIQHSEGRG